MPDKRGFNFSIAEQETLLETIEYDDRVAYFLRDIGFCRIIFVSGMNTLVFEIEV